MKELQDQLKQAIETLKRTNTHKKELEDRLQLQGEEIEKLRSITESAVQAKDDALTNFVAGSITKEDLQEVKDELIRTQQKLTEAEEIENAFQRAIVSSEKDAITQRHTVEVLSRKFWQAYFEAKIEEARSAVGDIIVNALAAYHLSGLAGPPDIFLMKCFFQTPGEQTDKVNTALTSLSEKLSKGELIA